MSADPRAVARSAAARRLLTACARRTRTSGEETMMGQENVETQKLNNALQAAMRAMQGLNGQGWMGQQMPSYGGGGGGYGGGYGEPSELKDRIKDAVRDRVGQRL